MLRVAVARTEDVVSQHLVHPVQDFQPDDDHVRFAGLDICLRTPVFVAHFVFPWPQPVSDDVRSVLVLPLPPFEHSEPLFDPATDAAHLRNLGVVTKVQLRDPRVALFPPSILQHAVA